MVHRVGVVPVGESSIAIVVSAPHRKAASMLFNLHRHRQGAGADLEEGGVRGSVLEPQGEEGGGVGLRAAGH